MEKEIRIVLTFGDQEKIYIISIANQDDFLDIDEIIKMIIKQKVIGLV